jgi:hypothetical protein
MGSIPIEIRNINNEVLYEDLPICLIDDWSEITPDFLESEWDRIHGSYWNAEKLNFKYWKNLIKNETISNLDDKRL